MQKPIRATVLLAVAVAVSAGLAAAAAGPSVTITSPSGGQKISARHTTYLALAGTASFATRSPPRPRHAATSRRR